MAKQETVRMRTPDGNEARVNAKDRDAMRAMGWVAEGESPRSISPDAARRMRRDHDQRATNGQSYDEAQRRLREKGLEHHKDL